MHGTPGVSSRPCFWHWIYHPHFLDVFLLQRAFYAAVHAVIWYPNTIFIPVLDYAHGFLTLPCIITPEIYLILLILAKLSNHVHPCLCLMFNCSTHLELLFTFTMWFDEDIAINVTNVSTQVFETIGLIPSRITNLFANNTTAYICLGTCNSFLERKEKKKKKNTGYVYNQYHNNKTSYWNQLDDTSHPTFEALSPNVHEILPSY